MKNGTCFPEIFSLFFQKILKVKEFFNGRKENKFISD